MKTQSISQLLLVFTGMIAVVHGTPDRVLDIEEQLLASNENGFVILRTVHDSLGSYYSSETTTYLDEYEKKPGSGEELVMDNVARSLKSTTLLAIRSEVDPDSPRGKPLVTHSIKEKASEIDLVNLLTKYPQRARLWNKEDFAKLMSWKTSDGDLYSAAKCFLMSDHVTSLILHTERRSDYSIDEVREDSNSIFIRVTAGGDDEGRQTRWICLLPDKTRQIRAHLQIKPFYFMLGRFKALEAAREKAKQIAKDIESKKESKAYTNDLEIWTVRDSNSTSMSYCIVLASGMGEPGPTEFEKMRGIYGADLAPVHSGRFESWHAIEEGP